MLHYSESLSRIDIQAGFCTAEARVLEWNSVYVGLSKQTCRMWKIWDKGLQEVLESTAMYVEDSAGIDVGLYNRWQGMVARTSGTWA